MPDGLPNPLLDLPAEDVLAASRRSLQFARAGQWGLRRGDPRVDWSDAVCALHRLPAGTRPELGVVLERVQEDQRAAFRQAIDDCLDSGRDFDLGLTLVRGAEERVFVRVLGEAVRDGQGHILGLRGLYQDHTESQREQVRGQRQQRLLAAVAAGRPLDETLEQLLLDYEAGNPGAIGSVLLLDDHGERVRHGAGARLPLAYRQAIDGVEIGEARGSCGTAAYRRERVIVSDIAHDPLWRDFAALALGFELRACWSTPILNSQGRVIATFAVYYRQVRQPSEDEILELDAMSELVALAVEQSVLLDNVQQVMDSDVELICVIDDRARFVAVNAAARRLWGREPASLVGQPMDCVIHPEDRARSQAEARTVMAGTRAVDFENRTLGPDGRVVEMSWSAVWSHRNQRMYCFGRDITAHRRFERELAQALSHDAVTALPRYGTLENLYAPLLARDAESQRPLWLIFIDLDRFQAINETMGEQVGDAALRTLAQRLQRALGGSGQLSRFAGDEFVAMVADVDAEQILHLAERIRIAVAEPVQVADVQLAITASIGVSGFPQHGRSLSELLRRAEGAMGQAKREGRDGICLYSAASMQDFEDRLALGGRLRQAVRADELELHYQPQVRALDGRITGFEALVRWTRSPLGPVPPGRFIPIAEALGMMPELGHWVLRQACQQAQRWIADGHRDLTMAVNVSAHQLQRPDFLAGVREALRESGLAPARLQVELTESSLIENLQRVRNALDGLRALGISLALDDFGTGYSSLSYLKRLAFDKLKIDRSFVADLTVDADDAEIARTIIAIGHQLRMSVAAEGVETAEQCAYLRTMGCDELQGFLLSRPVPADAAEALLRGPAFRLPD